MEPMARLSEGELTLEVRYRSFEYGWVVYDILWLWQDEPILSDPILKRHNEYWAARAPGGIHANEHRGDFVIPELREVRETGQPLASTTSDPDVTLAIYPEQFFPFLPSRYTLIYESDRVRTERAEREARKAALGKLPDDLFQLIMFVDAYNFKRCYAYQSSGVALHMVTTRAALERFLVDLRQEYFAFKEQLDISAS
jgi:hypothetical protein